jgi:hypothetical protein
LTNRRVLRAQLLAALPARASFGLVVVLVDLTLYNAVQLVLFFRAGHYPDFRLFWNAAGLILAHGPGAVFAVQVGAPYPTMIDPPLIAWLVIPLAILPFPVAFGIWITASSVALGWAAWLCGAGWRGVLSSFALLPVFVALGSGQVAPLLLLVVVWSVRLADGGRWVAAGALLAMLSIKPQMGILLPIVLVVSGRWRIVVSAAGAGAVIAALTLASLGLSGMHSWLVALSSSGSDPYFQRWSLIPFVGTIGWYPAVVLVALLVGIGARRWRHDLMLVMGLGLTGSLLINHYLTPQDLVMLLLPVWALVRLGPRGALLGGVLWTGVWLCLWVPPVTVAAEALVVVALALPQVRLARSAPGFPRVVAGVPAR